MARKKARIAATVIAATVETETVAVETVAVEMAAVAEVEVAEKAPRKVKAPHIVKNGTTMPREGTVGAKLWALTDSIAATCEGGYKALRLAVIAAAGDEYNAGNVRTELSLYRKFHGIPKATPAIAVAAPAK